MDWAEKRSSANKGKTSIVNHIYACRRLEEQPVNTQGHKFPNALSKHHWLTRLRADAITSLNLPAIRQVKLRRFLAVNIICWWQSCLDIHLAISCRLMLSVECLMQCAAESLIIQIWILGDKQFRERKSFKSSCKFIFMSWQVIVVIISALKDISFWFLLCSLLTSHFVYINRTFPRGKNSKLSLNLIFKKLKPNSWEQRSLIAIHNTLIWWLIHIKLYYLTCVF